MNYFNDLHQISGKEYIFTSKKYVKADVFEEIVNKLEYLLKVYIFIHYVRVKFRLYTLCYKLSCFSWFPLFI